MRDPLPSFLRLFAVICVILQRKDQNKKDEEYSGQLSEQVHSITHCVLCAEEIILDSS